MAWSRCVLLGLLCFCFQSTVGQVNRYMVFFSDKDGTSYSVDSPEEFLSVRAISRRTKQGLVISNQDIPVNQAYVDGVATTGAEVFFKTRWMNGILIQCDQSLLASIEALPYVQDVQFVAPGQRLLSFAKKRSFSKTKATKAGEASETQLAMLGIPELHQQGYRGEGIHIAVFDAGFLGVNSAAPFQHLVTDNRILLTRDFICNSSSVYQYDEHGTEVLSIIGAYEAGAYTGGAYNATFQLYVTEDVSSEYRIEEYNWLFAAEQADSAGVDVINSSLGYYDFDDNTMNYQQSDMDGETSVVTRAAQWAASKGIVVVCSAGNEGSNSWQIITAPADARDVLAVASVNSSVVRVPSSSKGPAADGRIKPDVAAMGGGTAFIVPAGNVSIGTGTSFAAPLITSLVSVLWQSNPDLTNYQLIDYIRKSASQSAAPDNLLGYGIPHTQAFKNYIAAEEQKDMFVVYPNPTIDDTIWIRPHDPDFISSCSLELINSTGQKIGETTISFTWQELAYPLSVHHLARGIYLFRIIWDNQIFVYRFVKSE